MITLHHGSNLTIETVDLSKSKHGKDFGRGFYLNPDFNQALKWAESRVDFLMYGDATVTSFEFDIESAIANGINVKVFNEYSKEWAEFVVANRKICQTSQFTPTMGRRRLPKCVIPNVDYIIKGLFISSIFSKMRLKPGK